MPAQEDSKRTKPNRDALVRIQALTEYRELYLRQRGRPPVWTATCNMVGIRIGTVLRYAPELAEKWYNVDFHG